VYRRRRRRNGPTTLSGSLARSENSLNPPEERERVKKEKEDVFHRGEHELRNGCHLSYTCASSSSSSPSPFSSADIGKRITHTTIEFCSDHVGKLNLHWGIRKGRFVHEEEIVWGEEWLLPPPEQRAQGTMSVGGIALQTPFVQSTLWKASSLSLSFDMSSSFFTSPSGSFGSASSSSSPPFSLIFLLKDIETGHWFDCKGENFTLPLQPPLPPPPPFRPLPSPSKSRAGFPPRLSSSPPEDLCHVYAYLRWEEEGHHQHAEEEGLKEAERELSSLLAKGMTTEDLWKAAVFRVLENKVQLRQQFELEFESLLRTREEGGMAVEGL